MANVKVTLDYQINDGMSLTFKAPCDCTAVTGLKIYYPNLTDDASTTTSKTFTFKDAHGNNLTSIGNLFTTGAYVKVVLDTTNNVAYIQNADTNGYLEDKFSTLASTNNGTVMSANADYAEIGEWADGNTSDEDRIGYFVAVDTSTNGTTMVKATSTADVRGVTVTSPAFSGNCSSSKFDSDGNLLKQYDYVAVMGLVSVIDNGTCTVNGRCMPNDSGTAVPSTNNMGYQVIDRIDSNHILIAVEPSADMIQRIKTDIEKRYTKTETDTLLAKKANSDCVVNPKMLINWYFGNPVDQRGGKIIPAGVPYYKNETLIGVTDKAYPYTDCFYIDGESYWTPDENIKRGYTGTGYGIDRWKNYSNVTALVESGCLTLRNDTSEIGYYGQIMEANLWDALDGKTITMSVLTRDGALYSATGEFGTHIDFPVGAGVSVYMWPNSKEAFDFSISAGASISVRAVNIELGSQQTLAHQDENGNWVLNEIPNYSEELLKCIQSTADTSDSYANKVIYHTGNITAGTADITANATALVNDCIYQVYE